VAVRTTGSGNICYRSVQNVSCSLTDIVPVIVYGCEICSLTSREEIRLRVIDSRVVRRIFVVRGR
jgi:hypothetical protein